MKHKSLFRKIVSVGLLLSLLSPAMANTYNVTSATDHPITGAGISVNNANGVITGGSGNGLVTIRSAIAAANNVAGPHTINVPTGTFNLTIPGTGEGISPAIIGIGDLDVTANNVTIHGAAMNSTIINQTSGIDRVFDVNVNFIANFIFTIDNLTISGGREQTGNGGGGMFSGSSNNLGAVTITNVRFDNNQAFQVAPFIGSGFGGGGLQHQGGDLILTGCIFNNNTTTKSGGALSAFGFRDLPIALPLVNNNMTVTNCTFTNNTCNGASGGGAIDFFAMNLSSSTVTVTGSSFSGNTSTASSGGAIVNESTNLTVTRSTFLNNQGTAGGAVYGGGGSTVVNFCRILNNTATTGTQVAVTGGSVTMNVNNNWWGVNTGPAANGAVANGGATLTNTKWLQLKTTASPSTICNTPAGLSNTSNITTSFLTNSLNEAIALPDLVTVISLPVTWSSTLGSLSGQQGTIQANGTATALFTSNGTGGNATVNTQVDNIPANEASPARANITVNTIPTLSNPANFTSCVTGTASFTSTITGTPAPTITWRIGTTALVNGLQGSGSTVSGQGTNTLTITNVQPGDAALNYNVQAGNICGLVTSGNAFLAVNQVTGGTVGSDQLICPLGDPVAFTESGASTGSGTLTYQWESSTTNCSAGFSPIGGATGITYDPPAGALIQTTFYRRVTTSTLNAVPCTANSNCITVTVNTVAGGVVAANQTICSGGDPAAFTQAIAASGTGALTYQWQSSTTNCSTGFSDIGGATAITYDPPAGLTVTTFYRRVVTSTLSGLPCSANSTCITVTVNDVNGGSVAANQTICSGGDPALLTQSAASTGSGALTYQWQSSTTDCISGFSNIGGATAITYDPPTGLAVTTFYRRVTTSTLNTVPCTANSNCITVTVNNVSPGTVGSNQSMCSGGDPAAFTESVASTGSGPLTYQWQSSTTSCVAGFSNIGGETATTYDPPAGLAITTFYRRVTTSTVNGVPCTANSNCITVTINSITVTNPGVTSGTVNTAFSQTFTQSGAVLPATFSTVSTLPTGLTLSSAGVLSGTPTQSGFFAIVVTVTGNNGCTGTGASYNLVIAGPPFTIGTLPKGDSIVIRHDVTINASPPPGTDHVAAQWTIQGSNFANFLSDDPDTGTPLDSTITALVLCPNITVTNPVNTIGTAGTAFSETFTASGGTSPYTFTTVSVLPSGLTLSAGGVLSGTPTQAGTFNIVVTATEFGSSCTGNGPTYTLVIGCPAPILGIATPASQTVCSGVPITTIVLSGAPAGAVYNWARDNTGTVTGIANSGAGDISGALTNTTAAAITVTFTITPTYYGTCLGTPYTATVLVNPAPIAIATPSSQTICSGATITTIVLSSATAGTTYTWTRDNNIAVTGIAAAGSGDISGSLTNTTNAAVTVTFTITPTAGVCTGPTTTATVIVNPIPNAVATPSSQTICSGAAIITIVLSGNVTGTVYNWTRDNTGTVTGIANSGAGNINGSLTNTTNAPITVTFTITPSYTNAGATCLGTPITATILVNPTPNAVATPSSQTICSGATITTIVLSGNISGTVFNWTRDNTGTVTGIANSGAGNISGSLTNTTANPIAVTFTITPTANSCPGAAITATVLVNPTPVAVATPSSQTICSGNAITTIVLSSTTTGTTYTWTRDNTGTVTGIAANGTGNISGSLTNTTANPILVTFTITPTANSCPGTAITATVLVNPGPAATATPSSQTICSGATITTIVMNSGTPGVVFNWTRDNTGTVTGIAASGSGNISGALTNTTAAPVTVTFTITPTAAGCVGPPITATVLVNPTPIAIATPASQTICSGATITIIVLSSATAGTTYTWTRDNNVAVTGIGPSGTGDISGVLTNTTANPITVTFTITPTANGCAGPTTTATVLVNPTPNAVATPPSQTICSGATITTIILSSSTAGTTFTWTRDNTGTVTGIAAAGSGNISGTLTNTTAAPVTVTFTITPTANGCTGSSITATVLVNPSPNAVATPSSQTICSGATITTIVLSSSTAGTTYTWTRDNTGTVTGIAAAGSGDISGALTNTTAAPVTVTFTITPSANGCNGPTTTATVLVNPTPNAIATPSSQTICSGAAITMIVLSSSTAGTTYAWTRDNTGTVTGIAAAGSGNISGTLTNTTAAPITVTFTITPTANSCPGAAITATVLVNPTPDAVATPSSQTTCSGQTITTIVLTSSVAGATFNWTRDNNATVTGIAAAGSGNISGALTNLTASPITVTFTITPTGAGCPGASTTATVLVNPTPDAVATPASQTVCSGPITTIVITGTVSGTVFNWTRDNNATVTGIAAAGSGDISGTLTNTTNAPVTVTFTITPTAAGCTPGAPITATVLVNPIATVNQAANQVRCHNASTAAVNFSSPTTGGTIVYNWTNDNTSIGLAASGTGNIGAFVATNPGTTPQVATITVTPTYTNGVSCTGTPMIFTITVNPIPNAVATPASQTICSANPITTIVLSGNVSGTTYNWTRTNTVNITGIPAAGSGNISGTLTNNTNLVQTTTFTITPTANGCAGSSTTATVTVNPTPTVTQPLIQVIITGNGSFADEITWTLSNSLPAVILSGGPYGFNPPATPSASVPATNAPFEFFIEAQGFFNDNACLWEVRCNGAVVASGCIRATGNGGSCPSVGTLTVSGIPGCDPLAPQTICSGSAIAPITLTGPVAGTVFNWTRDNTVNVTGIAASGTGTISGTLTNTTNVPQVVVFTITPSANGCNGTPVTATITVNPIPNAVATPSSQTICSGVAITPIALTGNVAGTVYSWTRTNTANITGIPASGTGNISGTLTNTTTSLQTTTFTITPSYTNAGVTCTGTPITATVSVQAPLILTCPANITVNAAPGTCAATVTYAATVTGTPAPTVTYVPASGSSFPVGTTTVTVTATNICATVTCTFTVTVLDVQIPVISTQPLSQSKCVGDNVTFTVVSTFASSYQWQTFTGGVWVNIPGTNAPSYSLSNLTLAQNATSYRVLITGPCGTVTASNHAVLNVYPIPVVVISASIPPILLPTDVLTLTANTLPPPQPGGTFVWRKNGVVIVGATGPTLGPLTVNDVGSYTVTYTVNGCSGTSAALVVSAKQSDHFYVYPNPNFGQFQVRFFNQTNEQVTLTVYDAKGSQVYQRRITTTTPYTSLDVNLGNNPQGSYLVVVHNSANQVVGSQWVIVYH